MQDRALLVAALYAMYLADSVVWLRPQELLVTLRRGKPRSVALASLAWQLGGKSPVLPNPFTPFRAQHKLSWLPAPDAQDVELGSSPALLSGDAPNGPGSPVGSEEGAALADLGLPLLLLAVVLLGALPLALLRQVPDAWLLGLVLYTYALTGLLLLSAWLHRAHWRLRGKSWAALAFGALACPPFALNLVRRLCERRPPPQVDPVGWLLQELPAARSASFAAQLQALAQTWRDHLDEGSWQAQALHDVLQQVEPLRESERD